MSVRTESAPEYATWVNIPLSEFKPKHITEQIWDAGWLATELTTEDEHTGWQFRKSVSGEEWRLTIDQRQESVRLEAVDSDNTRLEIENVKRVFMNNDQTVYFVHKNETSHYVIADHGKTHAVISSDGCRGIQRFS